MYVKIYSHTVKKYYKAMSTHRSKILSLYQLLHRSTFFKNQTKPTPPHFFFF